MPNCQLDVLGDPVGLVDGIAVLGDGTDDTEMVHFLERTAAQVLERTLAAEDEDGRIGAPCIGDAGHTVGYTGAGSDGGDADLARVATRPGVRGVDCSLLMTDVDDLDALIDAAVVDRHDMAAGEREEGFDASLFESASRELATVNGHGGSSCRNCGLIRTVETVSETRTGGGQGPRPSWITLLARERARCEVLATAGRGIRPGGSSGRSTHRVPAPPACSHRSSPCPHGSNPRRNRPGSASPRWPGAHPSARLYSSLPRSSQKPSTTMVRHSE